MDQMRNSMFEAIVEIPKGSFYKYENINHSFSLKIDRVLNQACPFNYGFVPNTRVEDGDPLDVFIISREAIPPLVTVEFTIIGMLKCVDNGDIDDKVIGVIRGEEHLHNLDEAKWQIRNFLSSYKSGFKIESFADEQETIEYVGHKLSKLR
jgi:inorganic pyrophosphatase